MPITAPLYHDDPPTNWQVCPPAGLCKPDEIAYSEPAMHDVVSDENLMLQYKDGDAQAFETLYARYRRPLFRYLQHQCGNAAIAEELFQDIWLNLIRTRERYHVAASFKTYIYHLAHNRLIDYYRKQKHGVPASYDEDVELLNLPISADPVSAERRVQGQQQLMLVLNAIADLPEAQREAFLLKENTGLSVEQIAEITGVNAETAKSRIRYALTKLRNCIELDDHD
jgi:RNA polymerase sigma-70 factor (ECF subfamily)